MNDTRSPPRAARLDLPVLPRRRRARGAFTLIEVMIAIALSAFAVAGLYGLFSVQSRQLMTQDINMEMHQNLRFASDMLTRSVRVAGFGTAGEVAGIYGPNGASDENDLLPVIIPHDGGSDADAITVVYADPSLQMETRNDIVPTCDTTELGFRADMLDYSEKLQQYVAGDTLLCMDFADISGMKSYLWSIAGAPDTTNGTIPVGDLSGYSDYAALCEPGENLSPIISCSRGTVATFYIDAVDDGVGPGSESHPVLMMDSNLNWPASDDVPLVDNIEDMQIEYCLDDGTKSADCSLPTSWDDDFDTAQITNVWMVRISLLVRSARPDFRDQYPGKRPALGNRNEGGDDNYYRETLVNEVTVRNLRYQAGI